MNDDPNARTSKNQLACQHTILVSNDPVRGYRQVIPCPYCERDQALAAVESLTREHGAAKAEIERLRELLDTVAITSLPVHDRVRAYIRRHLSSNPFCERSQSASETTASPQAPIALLTVSQAGEIAGVTMYAPGLPPGDHDLYCEPEAVAPMMRAEKASERHSASEIRQAGTLHPQESSPLAGGTLPNTPANPSDRVYE